jgi:hypothetical protein
MRRALVTAIVVALLAFPYLVQPVAAGSKCYGDGQSGNRFQALFVYDMRDNPDTINARNQIRDYLDRVDTKINDAAQSDGQTRHLRTVHGGACNPIVDNVQLSPGDVVGIDEIRAALVTKGYDRTDRKYELFVWFTIPNSATNAFTTGSVQDDRPGQDNPNNAGPTYAWYGKPVWWNLIDQGQAAVVLHETMHLLGAVQSTAPHSNGSWHCTDGVEVMCDGTVCTGSLSRIDCNKDDYFNVNPTVGSYLDTHWNTANSSFLGT